jgi:hypothetical protein
MIPTACEQERTAFNSVRHSELDLRSSPLRPGPASTVVIGNVRAIIAPGIGEGWIAGDDVRRRRGPDGMLRCWVLVEGLELIAPAMP